MIDFVPRLFLLLMFFPDNGSLTYSTVILATSSPANTLAIVLSFQDGLVDSRNEARTVNRPETNIPAQPQFPEPESLAKFQDDGDSHIQRSQRFSSWILPCCERN
ncbi:hypothetical protein R3P38DRAFT_6222 [Favolaschia claudopus]|uniref:Secreted protein n=1 Tax=Favolaschia claudopus TaxID=2862362 RepID=A0AAW0EFK7_9AGAR